MKLRRNRIKIYCHKKKSAGKDNEGNMITSYIEPKEIKGIVWPAGGKLQAEMYGERLNYIRNFKVEGTYTQKVDEKGNVQYVIGDLVLQESDGICLYASSESSPDYKIISIKPYDNLRLELEKL